MLNPCNKSVPSETTGCEPRSPVARVSPIGASDHLEIISSLGSPATALNISAHTWFPGELGVDSATPYCPTSSSSSRAVTAHTGASPVTLIELDKHRASKEADAKRKLNAEASARFRSRRKIKEKELLKTIHQLEQKILWLEQEKDFYRRERDFLRDWVGPSAPLNPLPQRFLCPKVVNNDALEQ